MNKPKLNIPFEESYWVIPGQILAGEYPASKYFEYETRRRLTAMLLLGIDTWIDLTAPGELPDYEAILLEEAGWMDKPVTHNRYYIEDFGIPTPDQMQMLLDFINKALQEQHRLYIHCYAGIGRTGTVVGCFLAQHKNISGEAALALLADLRKDCPASRYTSPQSLEQWEMVKNWK
ncbi:MAG: dual specificity protein phosphatase family protein [Anaerolineae bacterium]|nr:dual specificity protein phosphatase family protein [Anaerolineae bacterium]